jgi:hypothetical protein
MNVKLLIIIFVNDEVETFFDIEPETETLKILSQDCLEPRQLSPGNMESSLFSRPVETVRGLKTAPIPRPSNRKTL